MVALANRMQQKLARGAGGNSDEDAKFLSYMLSLGIPTPVTKETAGTEQSYYRDLSRELAEFLLRPLEAAGGTMPLTDVYCVYNRARGSNVCGVGIAVFNLFDRSRPQHTGCPLPSSGIVGPTQRQRGPCLPHVAADIPRRAVEGVPVLRLAEAARQAGRLPLGYAMPNAQGPRAKVAQPPPPTFSPVLLDASITLLQTRQE
jgi:hypothetical protein